MICDRCQLRSVNGHVFHESRCPNDGKQWNADTESWDTVYTCFECGEEYTDLIAWADCCLAGE